MAFEDLVILPGRSCFLFHFLEHKTQKGLSDLPEVSQLRVVEPEIKPRLAGSRDLALNDPARQSPRNPGTQIDVQTGSKAVGA